MGKQCGNWRKNEDESEEIEQAEDSEEISSEYGWDDPDDGGWDEPDESMDGDHESALASCGWGTDEDYGCFGDGEW